MGEQSGNDKINPGVKVLEDGEVDEDILSGLNEQSTTSPKNLHGEAAPPLSEEEFKVLEDIWKVNEALGIEGRYHSDEIEPWDPDEYIRPTSYEDKLQEPVSSYELSLAHDFLVQLQDFFNARKLEAGKVPGRTVFTQEHEKHPSFSLYANGNPYPMKEEILRMRGKGLGYDLLRQQFGDSIVDTYFGNSNLVQAEKFDDQGGFFSNDMDDRKLLAEILFHSDRKLSEQFGQQRNPSPLWKISEEYNQNDTLGIFAKQYIYFLRFAQGTPRKELIEPEKVKNTVQ
jgi:hypothetical protein